MSNVIYEYNWRGLKTGWDYKLEIIPAGDTDLNNPTVVTLPPGTINVQKLGLKYDEYLSGFPEAPQLDVFIDLKILPEDIAYADFKKAIFTPTIKLSYVIDIPGSSFDPVLEFDVGTIFYLWVKFNGNSDEEVNIFRKIFSGCYRYEGKYKFDIIENNITISVMDINRPVLDSIVWFNEIFTDNQTDIQDVGYIELAYKKDGATNYIIGQGQEYYAFLFSKLDNIKSKLNEIALVVKRKLVRNVNETFTFDLQFPTFYKQAYNGNGLRGDEFADTSDLYVISKVRSYENGVEEIGGLFSSYDDLSISNRYGNSVWDYLSELCEFSLAKGIFKPDGLHCVPIFGAIGAENIITLEKKKLIHLEMEPANVVKTATSSLYETHADDKFSDIDKYEELQVGTQNEGQNTVPVVFNNMPTCVKYYDNGWDFHIDRSSAWKIRRAFYPHILNFFYFDKPDIIDPNYPSNVAFRIHEYCKLNLGNGLTSENLPGCSFSAFIASDFDLKHPSECMAAMQSDSCYPKWTAKTASALFGNKDQRVLNIKVDFNEYTKFTAGGDVGFPWYQPDTTFRFNLSNISAFIQNDKDKWDMISTELDFEIEEASTEMLQRMV